MTFQVKFDSLQSATAWPPTHSKIQHEARIAYRAPAEAGCGHVRFLEMQLDAIQQLHHQPRIRIGLCS